MSATDSSSSQNSPPARETKSDASNTQSPSGHNQSTTTGRQTTRDMTMLLPKLTLFKRGEAWNSSQIDERCFIYCTQTSRGRARIENPMCRTICIRRVFGHEVQDGSYDATKDPNGNLRPRRPLPLPGEGQPAESINRHSEVEQNEKTRYWKEGRYIWSHKGGRWITHEKVDTMVLPLEEQVKWMKHKENIVRLVEEEERTGVPAEVPEPDQADVEWEQPVRFLIPSQAIKSSFLLRVTPISSLIRDTLHEKMSLVLNPTNALLSSFGRSFTDGTQNRLFWKACEVATNGSTLTLIRNAWDRHEMLWKKLDAEGKVDDRKKKGGGSEVKGGEPDA
ncbi:hypothetical protein BU17DRAFT_62575 [Hysterangium stoloniferum]|nr:hypothetical protein BU17DRAFT_62575 [Hysterangium stoloniferum]